MASNSSISNSAGDSSLEVTGAAILANRVQTQFGQVYNGTVTLIADTEVGTTQSDITFNSTVDSDGNGPWDLTTTITPNTTYYWVDWTGADATNVYGTITIDGENISVIYTNNSGQTNAEGRAYAFAQTTGGIDYWTGRAGAAFSGASPYLSSEVANGPTGSDMVALQFAGSQMLSFGKSVENLAFSIVSMNGNGFEFNQDFDIVSYSGFNGAGPGYFGSGDMVKVVNGDAFQLNDGGINAASANGDSEPHGTIRFNKAFSDLTWQSQSDEFWNAFTVGITGTSDNAGTVRFNDAVGGGNALGDMTINSQLNVQNSASVTADAIAVRGRAALGGAITTSGDQNFSSAVELTQDITLTTTANGNIQTTSETSTIDGAYALRLLTHGTGDVRLAGAVGRTAKLNGLEIATDQLTANKLAVAENAAIDLTVSGASEITDEISGANASLTKAGVGTLTLAGASTYTGATTISDGLLVLSNDAPSTATSGFTGPGRLRIEPTSNDFTSDFSTSDWTFGSNLTELTIGKASSADGVNDATVTLASTTQIAGDITIYGANIAINGALSSSDGAATPTLSDVSIFASGNVTQTAAITADRLSLYGGGNFTLDHIENDVNKIQGGAFSSRLGSLSFSNSDALTIGELNITSLWSTGDVSIATRSGDLTLDGFIDTASDSSTAVVLNAGSAKTATDNDFFNGAGGNVIRRGADASNPEIVVGAGGRVTLYTGSIAGSTGLVTAETGNQYALIQRGTGVFRYGSDEVTSNYTAALGSGIHLIYREQPDVNISDMTLSMTYGAALPTISATGAVNGDGSSYDIAGAVYSTSNNLMASSTAYSITSSLAGLGYNFTGVSSGTLSVGAKALTISGLTSENKVYDGTTTATVFGTAALASFIAAGTGTSSDGAAYTGDLVNLTGTASGAFNNKDVADATTVSFSGLNLTGADAGNYIVSTATTTANITPKMVSLSAAKTYDGTNSLAGAVTIGTGVGGETLTYSGATSNSARVAVADKFIDDITLVDATDGSGGLASNYALPDLNATNAAVTITAATLTPTLSNAGVTKIYDGTTDTSITPTYTFAGLVAGDSSAMLSHTGLAYDDEDVTDASKVTASGLTIAGITGNNGSVVSDYVLDATSKEVAASITERTLSVTFSGVDKIYNGTTAADVTTSDNRVSGDALNIGRTASFADKNVGAGKSVTVTGVNLSGADASNYTVANTGSTTATITRLSSVTWVGGATGNWFDPANWAGGAVPDLANVAQVIIPDGVNVNFDTAGAVGLADASASVEIDSLGTAGDLSQANGTLNIGTGGITLGSLTLQGGTLSNAGATQLSSLTQSGGSFSGSGALTTAEFTQTGGSIVLGDDFTVTQGFSQGTSGTVKVTGNTDITDMAGGIVLGNLVTSGTSEITSLGGAITQATGTVIEVTGETTLTASDGADPATSYDITLDGANDFGGTVTATGKDIELAATGDLDADVTATGDATLNATGDLTADVAAGGDADLDAGGTMTAVLDVVGNSVLDSGGDLTVSGASTDLTTTSGGTTSFGATTLTGDLAATSATDITQTGTLDIAGTAGLTSTSGDIILSDTSNAFGGAVTADGDDVWLAATGDLDADVTATGDATLNATGDLTADVAAGGDADLDAGGTMMAVLDVAGNSVLDSGGDLTVSGASTDLTTTSGGMTSFGATTLTGDLMATSATDITQTGTLDIAGTAGLTSTSGDITLSDTSNAFGGAVTADGDDVWLAATGDLDADVTATGDATLNATGDLTADVAAGGDADLDAGGTMTAVLDVAGNSVLDSGGDLTVSGTSTDLTTTSGGMTSFGATTLTGDLAATSATDITQTGTLDIAGTAGLTSTSGDITLSDTSNAFGGAVTADGDDVWLAATGDLDADVTATGDATLNATGDLTADVAAGGDADLDAGGTMTAVLDVAGNSVLDSGGDLTVSGASTDLTTTSGGTTSFGATTLTGALNADAGQNIQFTGALNAVALAAKAGGSITQPAGSINVINGPNNLVAGTSINLGQIGNSIKGGIAISAPSSRISGDVEGGAASAAASAAASVSNSTAQQGQIDFADPPRIEFDGFDAAPSEESTLVAPRFIPDAKVTIVETGCTSGYQSNAGGEQMGNVDVGIECGGVGLATSP